jgi:peptide-N4-(N-acetyl-beta-glucosaminyl)asparagine amidase
MERFGDENPSAEDRENGASRIESYKCKDDGVVTRFPRYNNPVKLFETKTGRCGEYANAFTAICIALGHNARKCLDWTDHVWTEVYVDEMQRWVHLDPCDGYYDEPLAYEKGWGKSLTYVIGTSN